MTAVTASKDVEFLIGSIFIDQLIRKRRTVAASKDIHKVLAARRSSPAAAAEDLARDLATVSPEEAQALLGKYRSNPAIWGDRCAAGGAVLASPKLIGLMAAGAVLLGRDVVSKVSRGSRAPTAKAPTESEEPAAATVSPPKKKKKPAGKAAPAQGAPQKKRPKNAVSRLERWDDIIGSTTTADEFALESYEDLDEAEPRRPRLSQEDRDWIRAWTSALGQNNSGVRVERSADAIVAAAYPVLVARMRDLSEAGDDAGAVDALLGARRAQLGANLVAMLRRLAAVIRLADGAFELPARSERPEYEPVAGRIFYLVHMRDPFELNGYVVRTHFVLSAFSGAGFDVEPVTRLGFPNDLAQHRTAEVDQEITLNDHVFRSLPDAGGGQLRRPIDDYINAYADRIVELARERRPAAIHAASNYLNGLAAIVAARRLGIPCVYEVRGIWEITQASANSEYVKSLRYRLQRTLENEAVRNADRVVAISEPLRKFVIMHGAPAERVSVLPNGVDVARLEPTARDESLKHELGMPADAVVIGYIGSVVRYEGLDFIIEAMARLKKQGLTNFRFLLVGDGVALPELKAQAQRLGVAELCYFLGRVPRERVEALYSIVDVAPLPRRSLPVTELVPPLKPFEAMACAKAVIVSSVEALADTVIDDHTGLVVAKNDVGALSLALKRVIVDPELRLRLGASARAWAVENRSIDALVPRVRSIYADLNISPQGGDAPRTRRAER